MGARARGALAVAATVAASALAVRSCSSPRDRGGANATAPPIAPEAASFAAPTAPTAGVDPVLADVAAPSAGWEAEAAEIAADLRRILDGRPRAGAYAEARAGAARADLALFPPDRARVRRLLLGSERDRVLALAALAARGALDDDLLRIVLRSQRAEDDEVVRLLGAEIVAAVPPELGARHEDDLLRAFEAEPNPLVLAVALPALERMDEARLRALLRAQVATADPEMVAILIALARERLGAGAREEVWAAGPFGPAPDEVRPGR